MHTKNLDLEHTIVGLVRKYGILNVIMTVITACDDAADFAHLSNEKRLENYWRGVAVAIFDSIKKISDFPEKSKKY